MPSALDFIGGGQGFGFGAPETVVRMRAQYVQDPYSGEMVRQDWTHGDPERATLDGAAISSTGQVQADGSQRRNVEVTALLTLDDPTADVVLGDLIVQGSRRWEVVETPETDRNPFTGWQPTRVIALKEVFG